jgi:membrane protein
VGRLVKRIRSTFAARLWRRLVSVGLALEEHGASLKASAMAFDVFLGMLPLAAILGWSMARFAPGAAANSLVGYLIALAPGPAERLVNDQIQRLVEQGGALAPLGAVGFVWIASNGAHTAMASIQTARTGRTRAWTVNRAIAIGIVLTFLALVTASAALLVWAETALRHALAAGRVDASWALLARCGALALTVLLGTAGAAAFFALSTYRMQPVARSRILPGAFVSASLWLLVSWLFSTYVRTLGRFSLFYGSLAAVALLLIWLWLGCFLLLVGSEINMQIEGARKTITPRMARSPTRRTRIGLTPTPPPVKPSGGG